jgi:hypothetical protein
MSGGILPTSSTYIPTCKRVKVQGMPIPRRERFTYYLNSVSEIVLYKFDLFIPLNFSPEGLCHAFYL